MLPVAPMMELFSRTGYDNVFRPGWILHNISECGSCCAVALKTKDKEFRATALSAGIGAMLSGVSEPALYGVNLRLKKPMIGLVAGGIAGGAVAGYMGAKAFAMGYSSILKKLWEQFLRVLLFPSWSHFYALMFYMMERASNKYV